jgi:hypothetical protein
MVSSGILRRVALLRNEVSDELSTLRRLLVKPSVVPRSPILVTLMNEALSSSETSVLTRATQCTIPEDNILHGEIYLFYIDAAKNLISTNEFSTHTLSSE